MKGILLKQFEMNSWALHSNLEGLTHAESLERPPSGVNSLNWIVGHIVATRAGALRLLKAEPVWEEAIAEPYRRGAKQEPSQPLALERLVSDFDRSQAGIVAALGVLPEGALQEMGRKEPVGLELAFLSFHESYHVGQTGIHRRLLGHPGAIP
jgi:hypothetical protein